MIKIFLIGALFIISACAAPQPHTYTTTVCEHGKIQLQCARGSIRALAATYGRTDRVTCDRGSNNELQNAECVLSVVDIINSLCEEKQECVVPAENSVFTDPCQGTYKYATVEYGCVENDLFLTYGQLIG